MPELPDLTMYVEALSRRVVGHPLIHLRVLSPFLLRTVDPSTETLQRRPLRDIRLIGKRLVFEFDDELYVVLHLMIAGRLHWKTSAMTRLPRNGLAQFEFSHGTLLLTESGTTHRASLHLVRGRSALSEFDQGGIHPLTASSEEFCAALRRERHTLKRALTDPSLFSGIGNAYSDEILHRAKLSPVTLTTQLDQESMISLYEAMRDVLHEWIERLREEVGEGFPERVTAFREEMAVHGRYRRPCRTCGSPIQRIRYAENEANYCATCQTGGRLLADRALSRLLKDDWPRSLEEWEQRRGRRNEDARPSSNVNRQM